MDCRREKMKTTILVAILLFMVSTATSGKPSKGLPFINDDFQNALGQAKQRNIPLFVDVWAPW